MPKALRRLPVRQQTTCSVPLAELGRIQAMNVWNLTRAREKEGFGRDTRRKLMAANRVHMTKLALSHMPGVAPPKPDMVWIVHTCRLVSHYYKPLQVLQVHLLKVGHLHQDLVIMAQTQVLTLI